MSNIFDAVKEAVTIPMAAERYGLQANRAGMVCCPFHDDHHPSLKLNERYFYCFGCGEHGSVVDFASKLFNLRPYDAANKLAVDFGVNVPATAPPVSPLKSFRTDHLRCQRLLDSYLNLLLRWQRQYAPSTPDETLDDRYVEACQMLESIDYMASMLTAGSLEQRIQTVDLLMADGKMDRLEERLNRLAENKEKELEDH